MTDDMGGPMRTAISSIRRQLGDNAENPDRIFIEPSVGYRMEEGATLKETGAAISL